MREACTNLIPEEGLTLLPVAVVVGTLLAASPAIDAYTNQLLATLA